jgi:hypothetical protein
MAMATASAWRSLAQKMIVFCSGPLVARKCSHGADAVGQDQPTLEGLGRIVGPGDLGAERLAGVGIRDRPVQQVSAVDPGLALAQGPVVQEDVAPDDLAGGEVAVLDALGHVVLVDRVAEVRQVVGGDLRVRGRLRGPLAEVNPPRGSREADLHGVGVPRQHLGPGRAVALVDDHVAEVVLGVVRDEEACVSVIRGDVERLIGRYQNPGVPLRVPARHLGGVGSEGAVKRPESLAPQLVPIADEQGPAELAGIGDAPQEVNGDERLARARGERQERPLLAARQLLEHRPDRGVLVVAPGRLAARVRRDPGAAPLGMRG